MSLIFEGILLLDYYDSKPLPSYIDNEGLLNGYDVCGRCFIPEEGSVNKLLLFVLN